MTTKVTVRKYADRKNLMLRWLDPETGRARFKSAGTSRRREAERAAAKLEEDLSAGRLSRNVTWQEFRECHRDGCLSGLADATFRLYLSLFSAVERICQPQKLTDLTELRITDLQTQLRREGKSEATIGTYSRHLKAALNWAVEVGMLKTAPTIRMPKRAKGSKMMKGRPITLEEFERMLDATAKVVGDGSAPSWKHYLRGLWWSGLRLGESLQLHWDARPGKLQVDLSNRRPMLIIPADAEKGQQDRVLPMAPEFARFLLETPELDRRGRVFKLQPPHERTTWPLHADSVSKVVRAIGAAALVVVNERPRGASTWIKYASAHDLRRSFGERWSMLVMPQVLMELMRHESIETTLKYYVGRNAERTADVLWEVFEHRQGPKATRKLPVEPETQKSPALK